MTTILINNLNDGINVKNDPSAISEGGVVDAVGFDLSKEGVLEVAHGLATNDISAYLPTDAITWLQFVYIGTTRYILATSVSGLYANGTLIDSGFKGRFKAISFLNNIYLINGSLARRFDGTTCYQWGITAPTTVPTITAGDYLFKNLDSLEDISTWIANQVSATMSRPTTGADLVTNGTFTGSAAGWTLDAVDWTYNANAMDKDADGVGTLYQTLAHTIGKKYLLTFTISGWTAGSVVASLGGDSGVSVGADGTYYQVLTPTTAAALIFTPSNDARFTIDSVSVLESLSVEAGDSSALQINVAASTAGYSYVATALDLTAFSTGEESSNRDYIRFWLYVDDLANLDSVSLFLDVGDGTFLSDYFSYSVVSPGVGLQNLGVGRTKDVLVEETTTSTTTEPTSTPVPEPVYAPEPWLWRPEPEDQTVAQTTTTITRNSVRTVIDPVLADQVLSFWRRSSLFELKSATWAEVKIPKSLFLQNGEKALDWDAVVAIKLEVTSTIEGDVNVIIDGFKMVGGSDLVGDYWFMYTWGRTDGEGNIIHESSPSRSNSTKQINIIGPVYFDRHPFTYTSRPLSSDPQVDCGVFYAIGGGMLDFWNVAEVLDNTTTTDTLYDVGETSAKRKLISKHNEPAPAGTDMVMMYNKIWMIGDSSYPTLLRSSDILNDGTIAPEGWPNRNGYELDGNRGALNSIKVLNERLSVKGSFGEWSVVVNDPTDFLQVSARRVSSIGLLGQDAIIELPASHIYPTSGGFVESTGQQVVFILSDIEPLIDSNMETAIGINAGLVSYFTYNSSLVGNRTAKVDLYRGTPRFCNLNNLLFSCLYWDKLNNVVYGVYNGIVCIVDSGYTNVAAVSDELYAYLKSKVYRPGGSVAWTRVQFYHNTGGVWFRFEVYVDGVLKNNFPFKSTTRTRADFRFGPHSGYDFQFVITGDYKAFAKIYFPIGVFHSG